jgi:hypothetical protein
MLYQIALLPSSSSNHFKDFKFFISIFIPYSKFQVLLKVNCIYFFSYFQVQFSFFSNLWLSFVFIIHTHFIILFYDFFIRALFIFLMLSLVILMEILIFSASVFNSLYFWMIFHHYLICTSSLKNFMNCNFFFLCFHL